MDQGRNDLPTARRSNLTLWGWLSPRVGMVLLALLLAFPVTLFWGQKSSQAVARWFASRLADWPYWAIDWAVNSLVLAVALLLIFGRRRKSTSTPPRAEDTKTYRLLDDVALHGSQPDELGLDKFIARLARTVALPTGANSLVVGLEAPWGSGKSSALNLLCRQLERHSDNPIVVRFNPWMASGSDSVSRAFFSQLSGSLRNADEQKVATKLVAYGEMLEELMPPPARVLPRLGLQHWRRIAGRIPEIDIQGEWDRLSDCVQAINRPVVVIIDDIDRLEPQDVVTIFQLVKLVASFPRVGYVLAFDPKPVDAALEKGGMYEIGREYRDKIIQANISLPRIPYQARKRFLQARLDQRIDAWKFTLADSERSLLAQAIPLVLATLKTPRDIKRVLNKTFLAAEALRGEVNFADVFVFEAAHAIFPNVIDLIRQRPEVIKASDHETDTSYEGSMSALIAEQMNKKKRTKDERLSDFTRMYPGRESDLGPLLMFLFSTFFDKDADSPPAGDLRISDPSTLRKLLYQEATSEPSAASAMRFLTEPDSRLPELSEAVDANSLAGLLARVRPYVPTTSTPEPIALVSKVAEAVNQQFLRWKSDCSEDARWFTIAVLNAVPEVDLRWKCLEELISNREFIGTTETVLTSLLADVGLWKEGKYLGLEALNTEARQALSWLEPAKLDRLRNMWLESVRSNGAADLLTRFPNAGGVLIRWRQLSDQGEQEVQAQLEQALSDQKLAVQFVNLFPPGIGLGGIRKLLTATSVEFIRSVLSHPAIDNRTAERFREYLMRDRDGDNDFD